MFNNIRYDDLKIPKYVSESAADLLHGLLNKDPSKRLGSSKYGSNEIKQHRYFNDTDWDSVYRR